MSANSKVPFVDLVTPHRELEEELALRQSLLEIGGRLGAASATASSDIFSLVAERLAFVVPIKSLTIWMVDHDFERIRPGGNEGRVMTSMEKELGHAVDMAAFEARVAGDFEDVFSLDFERVPSKMINAVTPAAR